MIDRIALDDELLADCEANAEKLLPLRLTKTNMTLKTVRAITSEFPEDYEVVSPNYSAWKRGAANYAAEEAIWRYSTLLMRYIQDKGYVEEKKLPVCTKLKRDLPSGAAVYISVGWKEIRSTVIKNCGCSAVPSNRDQLKLLGVTAKVSGILIVPNENIDDMCFALHSKKFEQQLYKALSEADITLDKPNVAKNVQIIEQELSHCL